MSVNSWILLQYERAIILCNQSVISFMFRVSNEMKIRELNFFENLASKKN